MASRLDNMIKDGAPHFQSGVDASKSPSDIRRTCLAAAINTTVRGGSAHPRPGWFNQPLTFATPFCQAGFQSGYFQEGSPYVGNGDAALISSHSGRLFKIDLETMSVNEITPSGTFQVDTTGSALTIPAAGFSLTIPVNDSSRFNTLL